MKRLQQIEEILGIRPFVSYTELAEILEVSSMTVRREADKLESHPNLRKVPGGIMNCAFASSIETEAEAPEPKRAIASQLRTRIQPGMTVFIDAGATTHYSLDILQSIPRLRLITYDTAHLSALPRLSQAALFLCGGKVNPDTGLVTGPEAEEFLSLFNADIALLSPQAISPTGTLSCRSLEERQLKRRMMESAQEVILLAEASSLNRHASVNFAQIGEVEEVISDAAWSGELPGLLQELDIPFHHAPRLSIL